MSVEDYVKTFWIEKGRTPFRKRPKVPRAMEIEILRDGPAELADYVREWDRLEMADLEQEVWKQKRRVADAERALESKVTKKAQEDVRIGSDKMSKALARIEALKRTEPTASDSRMYPGYWVPVLVMEGGQLVLKPMRYQCRLPGWTEAVERKYPGTYNARRDKLESAWKDLFGHQHGLIIADVFYENVNGPDGQNRVLAFTPRDRESMLIACLWNQSPGQRGEPEFYSFAAITDEPEPEVSEAGHDRTIINIKPDYIADWLNPQAGDLQKLYRIFDDKRHPFYEHRVAA